MIPDLGKYATAVLSSYAATLVLLAGLVLVTLWQARRVKRALGEAEARLNIIKAGARRNG